TRAVSHRDGPSELLAIENNRVFPPGRIWGPSASSPASTLASFCGAPRPLAGQRIIPLAPCPITIPLSSHVIPKTLSVRQTATGPPPLISMRLIPPYSPYHAAKERPSGENAVWPTTVPGGPRDRASPSLRSWRNARPLLL